MGIDEDSQQKFWLKQLRKKKLNNVTTMAYKYKLI